MVLGYVIDVPDIKRDMLQSLKLEECAKYSNIYDLNQIDANFKLKSIRYNISSTYDGFVIVSAKFKQFCEIEKYAGLDFILLPNASGFCWFKVNNIIEFDTKMRKTKFLNYNSICKGYEEIIGANPVYLKNPVLLSEGFFRTDVCFGSFAGKSPLYLTGEATKKKLLAAGFKEIFFEKILDKYDLGKNN
ncbi:MAG TPA: hypothetical protein VFI29_00490 [Hanamia sp.]|nr:hypothetical protein [Hanamia sp.]